MDTRQSLQRPSLSQLDVAITVVAIDQDGKAARGHDVAHARAHLAKAHESDVRQCMARTDQRIAAVE